MRTTPENAELALLLEVAGTPKPGNVDRHREYPDLRFEHFLAGAVGARRGFEVLADDEPIGDGFLRAIEGMCHQTAGNTQFGAVLLLTPLVRTAGRGELTADGASSIVAATTVDDAAAFYEAFELVDVAVDDPPDGLELIDVRRGSDAVPVLESRELTLSEVMERSTDVDGIAREWVGGFERTFEAADLIESGTGPFRDRAAETFLELLADEPDTFVATQFDEETARSVTGRARAALDGAIDPEVLAEELVEAGINPGTTADLVAGGLFVALERGLDV